MVDTGATAGCDADDTQWLQGWPRVRLDARRATRYPGRTWTAKTKFKLLFPGGAAAPPDPPFKSAWRPPCLLTFSLGASRYIKCLLTFSLEVSKYIKCLLTLSLGVSKCIKCQFNNAVRSKRHLIYLLTHREIFIGI